MKKLFCILCSACLFCLLAVPSIHADLIIEPQGDSFYNQYSDDCQYLYRRYTANGAQGYVSLYQSPLSAQVRENVANGEVLSCSFLYTGADGAQWGGVWGEQDALRGWVRLSDCFAVADYISFAEAHEDDFFPYDAAYDELLPDYGTMVLWTYPCSGVIEYDGANTDWLDGQPDAYFSQCYEDAQGRIWGFINYLRGSRQIWVCLSDPDSTDIPADPGILPEQPALIPPADDIPAAGPSISLVAVWLVAGVAVVTGLVLRVGFVRKKKSAN